MDGRLDGRTDRHSLGPDKKMQQKRKQKKCINLYENKRFANIRPEAHLRASTRLSSSEKNWGLMDLAINGSSLL